MQNNRTRAAIEHNQELYGITDKELAKAFGCTVQTIQNKKKRPETMSMPEVRLFCKILKLTDEQIVEFVGIRG